MVADGESPERSWGVDSGLSSLSAPFDLFSAGGVVHLVDHFVEVRVVVARLVAKGEFTLTVGRLAGRPTLFGVFVSLAERRHELVIIVLGFPFS
jgi:hypothetical protein